MQTNLQKQGNQICPENRDKSGVTPNQGRRHKEQGTRHKEEKGPLTL